MHIHAVQKFLSRVTYKPYHKFLVAASDAGQVWICMKASVEDTETEEFTEHVGFHLALYLQDLTEERLIRECRMLAQRWDDHERDEFLKVDGIRIYNPHQKVLTQLRES